MGPRPGPPHCPNSRKNDRNGCTNSWKNNHFYDGDTTTGRVVAFSRFWRGDISENGLGDAGSEGKGVFRAKFRGPVEERTAFFSSSWFDNQSDLDGYPDLSRVSAESGNALS